MFKAIFYWSHYFFKKYVKVNKEPIESAYFAVCIVQFYNVLLILKIIQYFFTYKLSDINFFKITEKYTFRTYFVGFVLALPFLIINYIYIYRRKRREEIFKYYDSLSEKRKTKGKVFYWAYIFGTFFLFFSVTYYINNLDAVEDNSQEIILKEPIKLYNPYKQ